MNKIVEDLRTTALNVDSGKQDGVIVNEDFIFAKSTTNHSSSWLKLNQPYNIDAGRIMHILNGDAIYTINLVEHHIKQGDVLIIPPQSIVEVNSHSQDYTIQAITLPDNSKSNIVDIMHDSDCLHFALNDNDDTLIRSYFDFIWLVIKSQEYQANIVTSLSEALYQNTIFMYNQVSIDKNKTLNRRDILMKKFFVLVKLHSTEERNIDFYAKELCVSSCYLSIIVKKESGHSVMYWINRSLIYRAKVALQYSDKNITEISDELNFSNTSFFCKFFKNATGVTPTQYRHNPN